MKRSTLLRHLRKNGCSLKREGPSYSLWWNPNTGAVEAVPRHLEMPISSRGRSAGACRYQKSVADAIPPMGGDGTGRAGGDLIVGRGEQEMVPEEVDTRHRGDYGSADSQQVEQLHWYIREPALPQLFNALQGPTVIRAAWFIGQIEERLRPERSSVVV